MRAKLNGDVYAGLFFMIVGSAAGVIAGGYQVGSADDMGPGFLPLVLSLLLVGFGAVIGVRGLKADTGEIPRFAWSTAIGIAFSIACFGPVLERFGLVVAIPALTIASRVAGGDRHWLEIAATSAVLTLFCIAVFVWALNGSLPVWVR